jgi:catechol 2,3-dioxygenase-like lactoylglutathione lyase family enzyme
MINGTHAIVYAEDAERARVFFRDVLGWPHIDAHDGWLIFRTPPAELGVHPADQSGGEGASAPSGHHELYLMCDDIERTVAELTAKGVEFTAPVEQQVFGRLTRLRVPGAGEIGLYQPRHQTAYDLEE